jgi:hypothetical protein
VRALETGNVLARLHGLSDELSDNSHDQHWAHADMRGQNLQASQLTTKVNERQDRSHRRGQDAIQHGGS